MESFSAVFGYYTTEAEEGCVGCNHKHGSARILHLFDEDRPANAE
jgi:hypothetical protein